MELDARKLRILEAIIDDYILTASPVGSRTISKRADIQLSSATIRNEMSDLEEMGYLEQPHTSAGRIPSDKAYRLYVNRIMQRSALSEQEQRYIRDHFSKTLDEVEDVVKQTAWVLSSITQYTSMVLTPQLRGVKIRHIQLVPVSEGRALAVIVTDAGITKDSILRIPRDLGTSELERLSRMLTERFANARLDEVSEVLIPRLMEELGENRAFLNSTLEGIRKSLKPDRDSVALSGTTHILNYPEYSDMEKAKHFLSAMEGRDTLVRMLSEATKVEFSVTIGKENEAADMQDCSVVTATYRIGDEPIGSLGVIGPTRMNYSRILAVLDYMGRSLSEVLTNMFEEERRFE